jgi:hypothetical protein
LTITSLVEIENDVGWDEVIIQCGSCKWKGLNEPIENMPSIIWSDAT